MSLDDDLRRSLPSQNAMREISASVQAVHKSVGFAALEEAKKIGQVMSDAQMRAVRGLVDSAMPRIDISALTGSMAREFEREYRAPEISTEWMAAEAERRWAVVETRDAIYALHEKMEAARVDAQAARAEARSARRLNLALTIAVLVLAVPGAILAAVALIALL